MIVHQLVDQKGPVVRAKCGYEVTLRAPWELNEFSGFDSRVTCERCKPIKQEPGKPRRYRIKRKT